MVSSCPNISFTFSWTNSGTGWYIQLSQASDYSNPYQKWVSGLTTYTGPTGFVLQSNGTTPLSVTNGATYYWRIWDGTTFTVGPSFTIPYCDTIPPTTSIATTGNWKTQDFTATFTDADNTGGSGVSKKYYQVIDFNGTYWRANAQRGFFADNFDNLDPTVWTVPSGSGTWTVNNGSLVQSDESVNNTNIYSALDQTLSNRYLYHFIAKIEGAGHANGRRFGFHYFCDDASQTNRGNSYFVWFRIETNKLEFYKVTNNVFTMVDEIDDIVTSVGTFYDYKIIYDRITGDHFVYRDNTLIGSWKDTSPLSTNGNYISFRSGNSKLTVNELKVYRTRTNTASITLGNNPTKDIRYQNPSPNVSSAKIKSLVIDTAGNISGIAYHDLNVDWTNPSDIGFVNDGTGADIDTTASYTEISANWSASTDMQSGIADYWYAIGTAPGDSNTVGWTNNGTDTAITHSGLNLTFNMVYYVSVKAKNNAGLFSNVKTSNGQVVYNTSSTLAANFIAHTNSICEGDSIFFSNQSNGATSYDWVFQGGSPGTSNQPNPVVIYNTPGTYGVELRVYDNFGNADTLSLSQYIVVNPKPVADFSVIDSIIYLPAANAYFVNQSAQASDYYWSFGDSYVSTDANPWHQYTAIGYYTVQLIATNNLCRNDTLVKTDFIQVLNANSIDEQDVSFTVNILNNPVSGQFVVQLVLTQASDIKITLTDQLGRDFLGNDILHYDAGKHDIIIKADSRPASGIYYLSVTSGKGERVTRKVMIN
ncbi:MAG: PKD domain protein [Bacteroidetes bacterium ADurb.Bin408]|nr:MAG: PKD domain protein [Bacteroidetes bacterium ADurb.Bin408]